MSEIGHIAIFRYHTRNHENLRWSASAEHEADHGKPFRNALLAIGLSKSQTTSDDRGVRGRFGGIMVGRFRLFGVAAVAAALLVPPCVATAQWLSPGGKAPSAALPPYRGLLDEPGPPSGEVAAPRRRLATPAPKLRRVRPIAKRAAPGLPVAKRAPTRPPGSVGDAAAPPRPAGTPAVAAPSPTIPASAPLAAPAAAAASGGAVPVQPIAALPAAEPPAGADPVATPAPSPAGGGEDVTTKLAPPSGGTKERRADPGEPDSSHPVAAVRTVYPPAYGPLPPSPGSEKP
jgi:hypothetical protein